MTCIVVAESVTQLGDEVRGAVLVAGSHGGIIAAYLGARAGARALILNDAGIGLDDAGIAGLAYLDSVDMAAATVAHDSARIGDGVDSLARGRISRANAAAAALGVVAGMSARESAERLRGARLPARAPPPYSEARFVLRAEPGECEIRGLDSIGKVEAGDAGCVLVIGSHGALHGGRPESALPVDAAAAVFNDAGVGIDGAGLTRLAVLDDRGIPSATVDCWSARIGDARSMWSTGLLSHANRVAARIGAVRGMSAASFAVAAARRRAPPR